MTHADIIKFQYNALVEMYNLEIFPTPYMGVPNSIVERVDSEINKLIVEGMRNVYELAEIFEEAELADKVLTAANELESDRIPPMPM